MSGFLCAIDNNEFFLSNQNGVDFSPFLNNNFLSLYAPKGQMMAMYPTKGGPRNELGTKLLRNLGFKVPEDKIYEGKICIIGQLEITAEQEEIFFGLKREKYTVGFLFSPTDNK